MNAAKRMTSNNTQGSLFTIEIRYSRQGTGESVLLESAVDCKVCQFTLSQLR